jgi:glycosyltransferase involved in cell wall biosynthesis
MTHVSAIVPTKNRSRQLRTALASIRAIEGPDLQIELIVVDNGSTDDTEHVAQEFDARFLRAAQPGAAAARNVGLEAATAEFVAFLDDDDAWLPEHVRPQLARLAAEPQLAAVVGQIVLTNDRLDEHGEPYPRQVDPTDRLFPWFLGHIPQVGATVARTSVRETVGYFDSDMEGDEDWDWHLRLALHHPVGFVPVPCMLFRQRPVGATADQQWIRLRNTRRVFIKNLRRAGRAQAPGPAALTRMFLEHNGYYFAYFASDAHRRASAGESVSACRALLRAVLASPAHAAIHLRQSEFRHTIASSLLGVCRLTPARLGV